MWTFTLLRFQSSNNTVRYLSLLFPDSSEVFQSVVAMSSRALRKLQGEVALGGGEKGEDDGASGEESPPSRGGQAFNAFSLVGNL